MSSPYEGILRLLHKNNEPEEPLCKLEIGRVKSVSPLIVSAAGLDNDSDDIMFISGSGPAPELSVNDQVLLLTVDYQYFYCLGRLC